MRRRHQHEELPVDRSAAGRILDAQLHLLDRQVYDPDGEPVMTVDDIEIIGVELGDALDAGASPPRLGTLLHGAVLGTRIFGGRPPRSRFQGVPWGDVTKVDVIITIDAEAEELDLTWSERWLREHVVGRIPGGRHDPQ